MKYMEKRARSQISFLPESVEDYISDENPVRVIDAFVDSLDMEGLGFQKAKPAQTGRPAYDPRDLLKLYLYPQCTRGDTLSSGLNRRWLRHRLWWAAAHLHPLSCQPQLILAGKSFGVFRERKWQPSKADEAVGLSPSNEDNTAGWHFSPEKPCGPLYTEGTDI